MFDRTCLKRDPVHREGCGVPQNGGNGPPTVEMGVLLIGRSVAYRKTEEMDRLRSKRGSCCDTTVCSVTAGVTVISPYPKDVYAPYISRYLPIIYRDAEPYFVSSQIASLHCTNESKIMHVKERVSHVLPSCVCMQPVAEPALNHWVHMNPMKFATYVHVMYDI